MKIIMSKELKELITHQSSLYSTFMGIVYLVFGGIFNNFDDIGIIQGLLMLILGQLINLPKK
jgi:hypothetical protein